MRNRQSVNHAACHKNEKKKKVDTSMTKSIGSWCDVWCTFSFENPTGTREKESRIVIDHNPFGIVVNWYVFPLFFWSISLLRYLYFSCESEVFENDLQIAFRQRRGTSSAQWFMSMQHSRFHSPKQEKNRFTGGKKPPHIPGYGPVYIAHIPVFCLFDSRPRKLIVSRPQIFDYRSR